MKSGNCSLNGFHIASTLQSDYVKECNASWLKAIKDGDFFPNYGFWAA